jgi:hypothetical protein
VQRAHFGHQVQVRLCEKKKKKKILKNSTKKKTKNNRFKGPATPADPQKEDIVDEAIKFFKVRIQREEELSTTENQLVVLKI